MGFSSVVALADFQYLAVAVFSSPLDVVRSAFRSVVSEHFERDRFERSLDAHSGQGASRERSWTISLADRRGEVWQSDKLAFYAFERTMRPGPLV